LVAYRASRIVDGAEKAIEAISGDMDLIGGFRQIEPIIRERSECENGERLLSAVEGYSRSFEKSALTNVFLEWMKRLERCIETDGDYVW
jgi:hypothetical protein